MSFVVAVTMEIVDSVTGNHLLKVQNLETVQVPSPVVPATAELFVHAIERLSEDVTGRSVDQSRQMLNQT